MRELHILGISGSLRRASFNTGLLRAAAEELPPGMTLELAEIFQFPLYNEDLMAKGVPEPVQHFKEQIRAADGILIATPEYNFSITGVLKNAIDWASRPVTTQPFNGKPLAMMGAGGRMGTVRSQLHLRQVAQYVNMIPMNRPEITVQNARDKFDAEGNLTDAAVRQLIKELLEAFAVWIVRQEGARAAEIR